MPQFQNAPPVAPAPAPGAAAAPLPRRVVVYAGAAALGGFLFGFETAVINGAVDAITHSFTLSTTTLGLVVAITLAGAALGAACCGWVADRWGRRFAMLIASVLFAAASVGCALVDSAAGLVGWRLAAGVAVGIASVVSPLYISEIAPAASRGRLASAQQMAIVLGIFAALLWGATIAGLLDGANADLALGMPAWRWMFLAGLLPAVLYAVVALAVPESPRYLVSAGRSAAAQRVLERKLGLHPDMARAQIGRIEQTVHADERPRLADVLDRRTGFLPVVWVGIGIAACQALVGIDVIFYYSTSLWSSVGFEESAAFSLSVFTSLVNVVATIVAIVLIDRIGRRRLLITGSCGLTVSLLVVTLGFSQAAVRGDAVSLPQPWGTLTLIGTNAFVIFFAMTWGPVVWVLLGEMFPNRIRAAALSISAAANWVAGVAVNLSFPTLRDISLPMSYGLYAVFAVLSGVLVWRGVNETKGRELEDMYADTPQDNALVEAKA